MYRLLLAIPISLIGLPLSAQAVPLTDPVAFNPVGRYRLQILSPPPRGEWSGLVVISAVSGHYEGTFGNPDGPQTYPVRSVEVSGKILTITMAGAATGSVFSLTVQGDSVVGTMTSLAHGLTQVKGVRLKQ